MLGSKKPVRINIKIKRKDVVDHFKVKDAINSGFEELFNISEFPDNPTITLFGVSGNKAYLLKTVVKM